MTNMPKASILLTHLDSVQQGVVVDICDDHFASIKLNSGRTIAKCLALQSDGHDLVLAIGQRVLVWLETPEACTGVVIGPLGRIVRKSNGSVSATPVVPQTLRLEAKDEIIIGNGRGKIKINAAGDVEIVCNRLVGRSRRLLRFLAPMIKLN